jgi:hypothetical protein
MYAANMTLDGMTVLALLMREGFLKYTAEIASGEIIYIPSLMTIGRHSSNIKGITQHYYEATVLALLMWEIYNLRR